jgi:hypothetical protein
MITVISWPLALQELEKLLPGCRNLLPDAIAEAAKEAGYSVQFVPLDGWEAMTDEVILQTILPGELNLHEPIVVVTDASFSKASPFSLQIGDLHEFVKLHFAQYKECVVNGDVIIILPTRLTIVLFHHEGVHSMIKVAQ